MSVQTSSWVGPRAKCCFELVVSCISRSPNVSYRPDSFQSSIGWSAGIRSSSAPAASISSRTIRTTLFRTRWPSGR